MSGAIWAGMYADQLNLWKAAFPAQLIVLQYEYVQREPQAAVEQVWKHMGLEAVPLVAPEQDRGVSGDYTWSIDQVSGLRESLRSLYKQQLERLLQYDIDLALWPNFSDA